MQLDRDDLSDIHGAETHQAEPKVTLVTPQILRTAFFDGDTGLALVEANRYLRGAGIPYMTSK